MTITWAVRISTTLIVLLLGCSLTRDVSDLSGGTCRADAIKNGDETDIDCGGGCGSCPNGRNCLTNADCQSGQCTDLAASAAGLRTCTKVCGVAEVGNFRCAPPCTADQVCVRRGDREAQCELLSWTCATSLVDCAREYCGMMNSFSQPGHIACASSCP